MRDMLYSIFSNKRTVIRIVIVEHELDFYEMYKKESKCYVKCYVVQ